MARAIHPVLEYLLEILLRGLGGVGEGSPVYVLGHRTVRVSGGPDALLWRITVWGYMIVVTAVEHIPGVRGGRGH